MPLNLSLQASSSIPMWMLIGIVILLTLIVLGLKFFRNMFEVITAPAASLKYHGENDNFFFSIMVTFLGGLIATLILFQNEDKLTSAFQEYSSSMASTLAQGNSNSIYQENVTNWARERMDRAFETYATGNLTLYVIAALALWFVIGLLGFVLARMFGGQCTVGNFLGSTAYAAFFANIGLGLAGVAIVQFVAASATQAAPALDAMGIAGIVLLLYGCILFVIAANNAADLSGGQTVGVLIFLLVLLGGAGAWIHYEGKKSFSNFTGEVQSYNPAVSS
jgi:hypothetical protein